MMFFRRGMVSLLAIMLISCGGSKQSVLTQETKWVGTWACAPQLVEPNNMPPTPSLKNNTIRQVVKVSVGGEKIRLRFSNRFSKDPVTMKQVAIALVKDGSSINMASQKILHFSGKEAVTILPQTEIFSDSLEFKLAPRSLLAITIFFGDTSPTLTGHPGSRTTSYILSGNQIKNMSFEKAIQTDHWYMIDGVEVVGTSDAFAIAVLGNSITDGRGSGTNKQNRWTDIFAERLLNNPKTKHASVLNLGIGGNCVLRGGLGPTALERFDRDILSQNNVKYLLILEGINDIGSIKNADASPKLAQELIGAYTLMIDKAHKKGIKVYGCTILPFAGSFYDTPFRQHARDIVNEWIRTGNKFDGVIDFDQTIHNPSDFKKILPDLHDKDWLHPNQEGYKKMGNSINLTLFAN